MWKRKELKARAKVLFKANYWKAVLAALILGVVVYGSASGGGAGGISSLVSGMSAGMNIGQASSYDYVDTYMYDYEDMFDFEEMYPEDRFEDPGPDDINELPPEIRHYGGEMDDDGFLPLMIAFIGIFMVILLIAVVIAILVDILLLNPLEVGIRRFFSVNLFEKAQLRELAYGFDHSYKNVVKIMFFRDLHTFLWTLLFIIPGIVKSYEYRMIPYLLAEYPEMTKEDAFAISKYMMTGNKWKTFVLDLSFILWILGNMCTLGLLGLFYGDPYMAQTGAVLYDVLKMEKQPFAQNTIHPQDPWQQAQQNMYQQGPQNMYQQAPQNVYQSPFREEVPSQPSVDIPAQETYNGEENETDHTQE